MRGFLIAALLVSGVTLSSRPVQAGPKIQAVYAQQRATVAAKRARALQRRNAQRAATRAKHRRRFLINQGFRVGPSPAQIRRFQRQISGRRKF